MHEGIGLAVITSDKAEALGRIEELDRAIGALAGRLALRRSSFTPCGSHDFTDNRKIGGRNLAATIDKLELQLLAFCQSRKASVLNGADMHESIVATIVALDEAEALIRVEELDHAAALADDLRRGTAAEAATARSAETSPLATAEAVAAAETIVAASKAVVAATEPVAVVAAISSVK
jgi:hypothetical protein